MNVNLSPLKSNQTEGYSDNSFFFLLTFLNQFHKRETIQILKTTIMKIPLTLLIICSMNAFSACYAQNSKNHLQQNEIVQKDTVKQLNLLDEQTKMFSKIFEMAGADNPLGEVNSYKELIEKMNAPQDLKKQIKEIYDLYDTSLDPKKKEELKIKVSKMIQEGLNKSTIEKQK